MTELQRRIKAFRIHLMIRIAGYSALFGLVIALVIVIAAPWLRDATGLPGYWLTILLPLIFPALYVAWSMLNRPDDRTVVLAADSWCGGEGSIISAWELEREEPDSAFVKPVVDKAIRQLARRRLPEPRLLRKMMIALLVLFGLVPLSRFVHAQMQESREDDKAEEQARKVDVPPKEAEKLAEEAAKVAELAKKNKAKEQERLAEDIEEAARKAQAGGQDKERALREANSLVDRAKAQTEGNERREQVREGLAEREITREMAEAIEGTDQRAADDAARKVASEVFKPDGIDKGKAKELGHAVKEAADKAPQDARLRRAAEQLENQLDDQNLDNAQKRREEMKAQLKAEGLSDEQIARALEKLNEMDQQALQKALEEFSKASSPLRDLDSRQMEELLKQLETGEISPEDAQRMAEAARQLSERLELDAEALREMLKDGREFEGLEKAAEEKLKEMRESGEMPEGPGEVPEWAKDAVPPEWAKAWGEAEKAEGEKVKTWGGKNGKPSDEEGGSLGTSDREGDKGGEGKNGKPTDSEAGGGDEEGGKAGGGKGGKSDGGDPIKPVEGGGKEEGVDTSDTGELAKDPNAKDVRLDPNKAGNEKANRGKTGRDSDSSGINTRDEEERLPRRYRDAARKYFER